MEREVAARLVNAWRKNWKIWPEIAKGLLEAGEIPTPQRISDEVGGAWVGSALAKPFFADKWSMVSDLLWNGATDEKAIELMLKTRPDKHMRHAVRPKVKMKYEDLMIVRVRERDKTHDWKTVK